MLRSLNSGVSGLKAFQTKLDVIGNNIANVNTIGYKKSQVVFEDLFSQTLKGANAPTYTNASNTVPISGGTNPIQVGLGTKVASIKNIFTPGSPTSTFNQTDLYIDGNGFFVVKDSAGKEFLTRAGNFSLDRDGYLVNSNGMYVQDTSSRPIKLPLDSVTFSVSNTGVVTGIDSNGESLTPNPPITIDLVAVTNPGGLIKEGSSLYSESSNTERINSNSQILSGVLEMSNVDLSEEMTDMITAQRGFQANAKIITVSDSILEELVNLKR